MHDFLNDTAQRMIATFCQTVLGMVGGSAAGVISGADLRSAIISGGCAAFLALLTALARVTGANNATPAPTEPTVENSAKREIGTTPARAA